MSITFLPSAIRLLLLALITVFHSADAQCLLAGYEAGFGSISCYKIGIGGSVTWNQANASCHADGPGAHLVAITNEDENEFVTQLSGVNLWIGLNDKPARGTWKWNGISENAGPPEYYNWQDKAGQSEIDPDGMDPNDPTAVDVNCVSLQHLTKQWSDRSCSSSAGYGFVCQSPGPPTSQPSGSPSLQPASVPTMKPSVQPSSHPSQQPFSPPTSKPSSQPVSQPSFQPNAEPSSQPSNQPVVEPTSSPSSQPSEQPSSHPSKQPASNPTSQPFRAPTSRPSNQPSSQPTAHPTSMPPTSYPSSEPTQLSATPTMIPSSRPTSTISVTVSSSMYILNSDVTTFEGEDAYLLALAATVCIPFGVLPLSISISSTTQVVPNGERRRLMGFTLVASTVGAIEFSEMPTDFKDDPNALPDYLNSELSSYIASGDATAKFRRELIANGVANENDILIITSNTNLKDYAPSSPKGSDNVLVTALVTVFVLLFVCCGAVFTAYWYYYVYKKEQNDKEQSLHDEDIDTLEEGKEYDLFKEDTIAATESFCHTDIFKSADLDGEEPIVTSTKETAEFEDWQTKMKKAEEDSGAKTPRRVSRVRSKSNLSNQNGLPNSEIGNDFLDIKKEFERLVLEDSSIS